MKRMTERFSERATKREREGGGGMEKGEWGS